MDLRRWLEIVAGSTSFQALSSDSTDREFPGRRAGVIRSKWAALDHHVIARFETFELDSGQRQLRRDGKPIHLTPKAFDFLLLLIEEAPRIVRKEELHKHLWPDTFVVDATLVSVVKEVRRALGDHASTPPIIRTAHRVGYGFAAALERNVTPVPTVSRWLMVGRRRVGLAGLEHVIGRDPASTIYIDAPGVSRRHARIVLDGGDAVLERFSGARTAPQ